MTQKKEIKTSFLTDDKLYNLKYVKSKDLIEIRITVSVKKKDC